MYELLINNNNVLYQPSLAEGIRWETSRRGKPSSLKFKVLGDGLLKIGLGNPISFKVDNISVFYGFIFDISYDKENVISITAYDQLRYLKNKDTYNYSNKTASQVIQMIGSDFNLNLGIIYNTEHVIPTRIEDNKTLFDIINNALDITLQNTRKMFVLYDDFGKLTLKNIEDMKLNILINDETSQDFNYSSSINGETYNQIKLAFDNKKTGKREIYISKDSDNINKWGVLQYYEKIQEKENGKAKSDALLKLYNVPKKTMRIKKAFGDIKVRAGCSVPVFLNLESESIKNYMIVERVIHTFEKDYHVMDLDLIGGDFS